MWYWPDCVLTDYERKFVSLYKDGKKPGVLRRSYFIQLATPAQPSQNIPAIKTIDKIQIARRSRVFAITFSGNLDSWRLSVKNSNGTTYTNPTPRTNQPPVVTSLIAGSMLNAAALGYNPVVGSPTQLPLYNTAASGGAGFPYTQSYGTFYGGPSTLQPLGMRQNFPWLIEPNWVCQPNETIIFEGADISPTYIDQTTPPGTNVKLNQVLNIAFYTWEFPGMGK